MLTLKNLSLSACIAIGTLIGATSAQAGDDDKLYGEPLPADAAFVRALGGAAAAEVEAFGVTLSADGNYTVVLADTTEGIETGQYVTVLPKANVTHVAQDDLGKVQIMFLNAGYEGDLSLKTADGKVAIAEAASNSAGFREVNPIVVPVAVFAGSDVLGQSFELKLRRAENPTIFVTKDGEISQIVSKVIWGD